MLDNEFMPPDIRLELQKHGTRECVVAIMGKTTMFATACHKDCLHYAQSVNEVVCCLGFATYDCGSQLNTSEMFWIDISR